MSAVRPDLVELNLQGVTRFRALNVDGTGLRIAARADVFAIGIPTARVDGGRHDGVTAGNCQCRLVAADGRIVFRRGEFAFHLLLSTSARLSDALRIKPE